MLIKLKKTEVTTVLSKPDVNDDVRNAINPKKYDDYRKESFEEVFPEMWEFLEEYK